MDEIRDRAAFPAAGMGGRGEGLFPRRGLDYEFHETMPSSRARAISSATRSAPIRPSRQAAPATSAAPAIGRSTSPPPSGHGKLYADAYSVSPAGIFVPPESPIKEPEDLAGVPISVGYQSGSHYSTIQALEQYHAARRHQAVLRRRAAVQPHGATVRPQGRRPPRCSAAPTTSSSSSASAR